MMERGVTIINRETESDGDVEGDSDERLDLV